MSGPGDHIAGGSTSDLDSDLATLTKTQLRAKYSGEATSHRNMLQRAGEDVHEDFREFSSFLRRVGPKPTASSTLDRIDNSDPEYAPGKVRWADKRTQNSNKGDSLTFHCGRTGEVYTTSRLAKLQGVSPDAIRKRHSRGWSDDDVIAGEQKRGGQHQTSVFDKDLPPVSALFKYGARPLTEQEVQALSADELHAIFNYGGRARARCGGRQPSEYEVRLLLQHKYTIQEFAEARAAGEYEQLPPHYVDANELFETDEFTYQDSVRQARLWWPRFRPYVRYSNCDPIHQKIIAEIDPVFVKEAKEKEARIAELESDL